MTTDQLRKSITVKAWMIDTDRIDISYDYIDTNSKKHELTIFLPANRAAHFLSSYGDIDVVSNDPLTIVWDDKEYIWEQFALKYKLSQYEALRIAIAYEYEKHLESDVNLLEMDAAIAAIKNS